jgi:hypothetical protein
MDEDLWRLGNWGTQEEDDGDGDGDVNGRRQGDDDEEADDLGVHKHLCCSSSSIFVCDLP